MFRPPSLNLHATKRREIKIAFAKSFLQVYGDLRSWMLQNKMSKLIKYINNVISKYCQCWDVFGWPEDVHLVVETCSPVTHVKDVMNSSVESDW